MRATGRMAWLLLSLSFLFHSACSNDTTTVSKNPTITTGAPTTPTVPKLTSSGPTGAPSTIGSVKTTIPTQPSTTKQIPAVSTPATTTMPAIDKQISTQSQAPTVTNSPPAHSTTISGAPPTVSNGATTAATTTLSQTKTTPLASTAATAGKDAAVSSNTDALQTPGTTKFSGTEVPATQTVNVGTTKIVILTNAPTTGPQSMTHTAIPTSQGRNGGADNTAVTGTSSGQTASGATKPAVNTGTTSTQPTLTRAGSPAAKTTNTGTTSPQTTTTTTTSTTSTTSTTAAQPKTFLYSLNSGPEKEEEKELAEVCKRLLVNLHDGNCTLKWQHHNGKVQFDYVEINGKVRTNIAAQYYEEITKKPTDSKTLIAILASCGALLIMIVILAVCASHRRKPYNENQQHLTEELHTVENGYHDNPTLEVMEVQPEMQEKKMALNGEFNDSWIVPIDNLLKEDIADEEDTHL
ncbi:hypothetical protein PFLUV_G00267790 [Perca fluviatilis]|uniref:Podocalyxin n=1 Tax=Perca fluviatilis TaxID=8168 RepID=A0A6A5E9C9_PERFL|nr:podocalyxin [Perca fluviatilis]KAF1372624.1 hypothetical protein PFLUV_G00267790 [Perca fluviatilis]